MQVYCNLGGWDKACRGFYAEGRCNRFRPCGRQMHWMPEFHNNAYKSFRKYLTAPPQEDVLAAAKELLSQQFQNLRVLNSQPPALAKHTKGDLHSIEQISERMLSTPTESSVEFMVAELDDALQSLMFRWNICYERYSTFRLSDNEKKKIGSIIQSGIDFLQKKKEVPL